jgi:hypothetical protein
MKLSNKNKQNVILASKNKFLNKNGSNQMPKVLISKQKLRISKPKLVLPSLVTLFSIIKRARVYKNNVRKFETVLLNPTSCNLLKVYESKNKILPQLFLEIKPNKFLGLLHKLWVVPLKNIYVFVNSTDRTVNIIHADSYSSIWLAWDQVDLTQFTKLSNAVKLSGLSKKHNQISINLNTKPQLSTVNKVFKSNNYTCYRSVVSIKNNLFKYLAFKAKFNFVSLKSKIVTKRFKPSVYGHRKHFKKFTNSWYNNANKNFKRFKSNYRFPKFKRRTVPAHFFSKHRFDKLIWLLVIKLKKRILKARKRARSFISRRRRLKNILKKFPLHPRWQKKRRKHPVKKYKHIVFTKMLVNHSLSNKKRVNVHKFVKSPTCFSFVPVKALRKWYTVKNPPLYRKFKRYNQANQPTNSKLLLKKSKVLKLSNTFKINMLQRALSKNKSPKKKSNKFAHLYNSKVTLKKINKQVNYKLKWLNYFEHKAFRWKFYKKRWYFSMSRWKRLAEFRRMLRKAWRRYRKLQKNFLFIKLLRANFHYIMGIKESELLQIWSKIRRGNNLDNVTAPVNYLHQSLQLKMDNLAVFLGLAPNRLMAQELVNFGGLRVNGIVVTKKNYSMNLNDMLQIDSKISSEIQALYKTAHWKAVRARLNFTSFLQVQWSIMLFMMVRLPQNHEIVSRSMLNLRWIRFFIRYFPVRISKYQKAKVKWYKY